MRRKPRHANGKFILAGVAPNYDVIVVDSGGLSISIYEGLRRRDPVLPHTPSSIQAAPANFATIGGNISGGGNYPLGARDVVNLYFFSPQADGELILGGGLSTTGPKYGPLPLGWNGATPISGQLIALGMFGIGTDAGAADAGYSTWLAQQPLTIANGQAAMTNLALNALADYGRVSGTIQVPAKAQLSQKFVFYRLPIPHASLGFPAGTDPSPSFDYVLPMVPITGAQLCVAAAAIPGFSFTRLCGLSAGQTGILLAVQAPPSLVTPAVNGIITPMTAFSFTPFDNGAYVLELRAKNATIATPDLYVFTSEASVTWPDLSAVGVAFPSHAAYQCTLGGVGPYATNDDALGPDGIGNPYGNEARRSYTQPIALTTGP